MNLAPGFPLPPNSDFKGYHLYIDDTLPPESPYLYGLHPNAEIGFLTTTSDNLFRTLLEMQPRDSGGEGGGGQTREEKVIRYQAFISLFQNLVINLQERGEQRGRSLLWSPSKSWFMKKKIANEMRRLHNIEYTRSIEYRRTITYLYQIYEVSIDAWFLFLQVKQVLDEIMEKLPEEFNVAEMMARVEDRSPYTVVAFQECERMNMLTSEMKTSLKMLDLGLKVLLSKHVELALCVKSANKCQCEKLAARTRS